MESWEDQWQELIKAGKELLVSDLNKESVADVVNAGAQEATYAEIGEQCDRIHHYGSRRCNFKIHSVRKTGSLLALKKVQSYVT